MDPNIVPKLNDQGRRQRLVVSGTVEAVLELASFGGDQSSFPRERCDWFFYMLRLPRFKVKRTPTFVMTSQVPIFNLYAADWPADECQDPSLGQKAL